MEKQHNAPQKHHKRPYTHYDDSKKRIMQELMEKHGMDEAAAVEVVHGIISLEEWHRQHKKAKQSGDADNKQASPFLSHTRFTPSAAVAILKAIYDIPQYQRQKNSRLASEKQAALLAEKENIPLPVAKKIVAGQLTLEEHLAEEQQKRERREQAIEIHKKYPELPLNVCYQVVDEKIGVQEFMERRTIRKQRRQNWYLTYLQSHQQDNLPLSLYLQKLIHKKIKTFFAFFDHDSMMGTVVGYTPYNLKIKDQSGKIEMYSKLNLKYFCRASYVHKVLSLIAINPEWRSQNVIPSSDPDERYQIASEMLQEGNVIELTMGGGEVVRGMVNWASSFDIKLLLSVQPKASIVVFRHAVVDAKLLAEKVS
jgi:hypothetical protein